MKYEFFLTMEPPTITHQEHRIGIRNGKPFVYEDARLADARAKLKAHLMMYKPTPPFKGAIRLTTKWCYLRKVASPSYKITRPDTDNMIKLLKDCMTQLGYWHDDAQVASEITEKFVVPNKPGIYICVEELNNGA